MYDIIFGIQNFTKYLQNINKKNKEWKYVIITLLINFRRINNDN